MLLNKDVFQKDPTQFTIPNEGVTKVLNPTTKQQWEVLRYELRNFVCEGEYREGLYRILSTYLEHLAQPEQPAVWVSGFYGSGKSHLVRVLEYLWRDVKFPDNVSARGLVDLPQDIAELMDALDDAGAQRGGLWSAAGTLGAGAGSIRLAILRILFNSAGLPPQYPLARFVMWLKQEERYDALAAYLTDQNEDLSHELNNLYVSPVLTNGLLQVYPDLAGSAQEVRQMLREQFPQRDEISDDELMTTMADVLRLQSTHDERIPCTLLVFDELQQFLEEQGQHTLNVEKVVEACSANFGSSLLFVATGQSALEARTSLAKMQHRFTVRVELSDKDVEEVVREVVLQKKPSQVNDVRQVLDTARGEIDRQLAGSRIGPNGADEQSLVPDYPLLPARRRFWERALRAIDSAGTSAQLRTQLRIVFEATRQVAEQPLGTVVPGDVVYEQQKSAMLQNGVLLREMEVIIQEQDDGTPDGKLRARLCATIFLVNQLPHEGVLVTGLAATPTTLIDLLVTDLRGNGPGSRSTLEQRVPILLDELAEEGVLMQVEGEYRLQTRESAAWQQDFRLRTGKIVDNAGTIEAKRNDAFRLAVDDLLKNIRLVQGQSKVSRKLTYSYFTQDAPSAESESVPVWVQSGWDTSEKRVREEAQAAGTESPIVFVFLPRLEADAIREALARREAAREVLNARPSNPTSSEAIEARRAMETRRDLADAEIKRLVGTVLGSARVFQGGGNEVTAANLAQAVEQAAKNALVRLFPNFTTAADDARWNGVIKRATDGNGDALSALGHNGDTAQHPVCKEVLTYIGGAGKRGAEVRKHFMGAGYGWPQDTVDGALMALLAANVIRASKNAQPVAVNGLAQSQIGVLDFEAEDVAVTTTQRITIRGFLGDMGFGPVKSGEKVQTTLRCLRRLQELATEAAGEAPLPSKLATETIDALQARQGNALLAGLYEARDELKEFHAACTQRKALMAERMPKWTLLKRLLEQAGELPIARHIRQQADAIVEQRSLLTDPDPVTPLLAQLTDSLRAEVHGAKKKVDAARDREVKSLANTPEWDALSDAVWEQILHEQGLGPIPEPDLSTDQALLQALVARPLHVWDSEAAAMPTRLQKAREAAAKKLNPQVKRVTPPSATLKTRAEVDAYLDQLRAQIMQYIEQDQPVIL